MSALAAELKAKLDAGTDLDTAVAEIVKATYSAHKRIVFNGDGYSDEWHQEAEHGRKLLNLRTTLDAVHHLTDAKNGALFEKFKVLSDRELAARQEIMYDIYFKTVNIEGETTEYMARTMILPAAVKYLSELHAAGGSKAVRGVAAEVEAAADELFDAVQALSAQNAATGGTRCTRRPTTCATRCCPP